MTMQRFARWTMLPALLALAAFTLRPAADALEIGSPAPLTDVKMLGVSGEQTSLAEAAGENGLLVLFSCNTCPWVAAWEDRYPVIAEKAAALGIGLIALNSNAGFRNRGDGLEDMKKRAAAQGYSFPYVLDEDAQLAAAFGATRTPEVFLFDAALKLAYHGAIDDNARNAARVETPYLLNAMTNLTSGKEIDPQVTRSVGCTIKFP